MPDTNPLLAGDGPPLQRSAGTGRVSLMARQGRNSLTDLYQEGAARIRLPRTYDDNLAEVVLINTAGGMTGGDRYRWGVDVAGSGRTLVTTQACEKVYRSSGGVAEVRTHISMSGDAALAWLPQETILFDHAALNRAIDVDMGPDATLLMVEPLIIGRQAMGENVREAWFRDRWRIWSEDGLVHAEDFHLAGDVPTLLNRAAVCDGDVALANLLMVGPGVDAFLPALRELPGLAAASTWQVGGFTKLLARLTAPSGRELRDRLVPGLMMLLDRVPALQTTLPKVWNL